MAVSFLGGGNQSIRRKVQSCHWQIYHIMLHRVHLALTEFQLTTLVVIGIDCIGICKSSYHTITTMTAPLGAMVFLLPNTDLKLFGFNFFTVSIPDEDYTKTVLCTMVFPIFVTCVPYLRLYCRTQGREYIEL